MKDERFVVRIIYQGDGLLESIKKGMDAKRDKITETIFKTRKSAELFLFKEGFERATYNTSYEGIEEVFIKSNEFGIIAVIEKQILKLNVEWGME